MKSFNYKKGIATLPLILVIGSIALIIALSVTETAFNELNNSENLKDSSKALFYAEAGARDALVRIARNKNYTCSGVDCYSINFSSNSCSNNIDCAKISVSSGVGTTLDPKIITSKGVMNSSVRVIEVEVTLDNGTTDTSLQNGEITNTVWQELTN